MTSTPGEGSHLLISDSRLGADSLNHRPRESFFLLVGIVAPHDHLRGFASRFPIHQVIQGIAKKWKAYIGFSDRQREPALGKTFLQGIDPFGFKGGGVLLFLRPTMNKNELPLHLTSLVA
jgi:hypothetical protein